MADDTVLSHTKHDDPSPKELRKAGYAERLGRDMATLSRQLLEAAALVDPVKRAERIGYLIGCQRQVLEEVESTLAQDGASVMVSFNEACAAVLAKEPPNLLVLGRRLTDLGTIHRFFSTYRQSNE